MATSNPIGLLTLSDHEAHDRAVTAQAPSFRGDEADFDSRQSLLDFYSKRKPKKAEKYRVFKGHVEDLEQRAAAWGSGKAGTPLAVPNNDLRYRFEALSEKHRMGDYLAGAYKEFEKNAAKRDSEPDFFGWVEKRIREEGVEVVGPRWNPACAQSSPENTKRNLEWFSKGVKYCKDQTAREHYEVKINGGGRLERQVSTTGKIDTFDSQSLLKHFKDKKKPVGDCIWVMSPEGKFYTHASKLGRFHHSSFTAGENVEAAGQWKVENGKITEIDGVTGHYRVSSEALVTAVNALHKHDAFSSGAAIRLWKADGSEDRVAVKDFVANPQAILTDRLLAKPAVSNSSPAPATVAQSAKPPVITPYSSPGD